jgi:hypothetical protein
MKRFYYFSGQALEHLGQERDSFIQVLPNGQWSTASFESEEAAGCYVWPDKILRGEFESDEVKTRSLV